MYGRVRFRYVDGHVVTSWDVEEVVKALSSGATELQLTLDLGLTTVRARLLGGRLVLGNSEVGLEDLAAVEEGFAYKVLGVGWLGWTSTLTVGTTRSSVSPLTVLGGICVYPYSR